MMLRSATTKRAITTFCRQIMQLKERNHCLKKFVPLHFHQSFCIRPIRLLSTSHPREPQNKNVLSNSETITTPSTSLNLPHDNRQLLSELIERLSASGSNFLLPLNNDVVVDTICSTMQRIFDKGVSREQLYTQCLEKPALFRILVTHGNQIIEVMDKLAQFELEGEDIILLLAEFGDDLIQLNAAQIEERAEALVHSGLDSDNGKIGRAIKRCPAVLWARDPQEMQQTAIDIASFFNRRQIALMIYNSPQILLMNSKELEDKYEYIYYHMNIEPEEVSRSRLWMDRSLEDIIERHQFLVRCGKYKMPDPKRPQIKKLNPILYKILDTNDEVFATKIAEVSFEEWMAFRAFFSKWRTIEIGEMDEPFVRFKPSMRKKFERRAKTTAAILEKQNADAAYVLEAASAT